MSVKNQLKLLVGGLNARRAGMPPEAHSATREFLDRSRLVAALIFVITVGAILLISSAGLNTLNVPVQANQIATVRVVAGTPFTFESSERFAAAQAQLLHQIPPVYRLNIEPVRQFDAAVRDLLIKLEAFERDHPANALADRRAAFTLLADEFNARGSYRVTAEDLAAILAVGDARMRATIFDNALAALRDIAVQGVRDDSLGNANPGSAVIFQIARPNGEVSPRPVQSLEDALTFLRVSLSSEGVSRAAAQALFRLFRNGVAPNVVFDQAATAAREAEALKTLKPVVVRVERGQTLIEAGQRVTLEQYEMFLAHRKYLREHSETESNEGRVLFGRVLLVLAMVLASLIYIRIEDPETLRSNVRCGLLALVVIINLAFVRLVYSLGGVEFFLTNGSWASTLPYIAPTAFAPLIVAILIDAGSAIFMALLISIFTGVIYGNRLDLLVLTFLASLVAIFIGREARRRGKVVSAAAAGGLTVAAFAALIGLAEQTPTDTLLLQVSAGLLTGALTGVAVVGLLPVLESLFKRTTDITLLELTDYNHPLLRRMQLEAPGTYHHSLVVAQLSENACNAIGANPLLARVCALFHDVGKTNNPSFFGENQRDRSSPHISHDPAASAKIIKQHVPDGIELARRHHLPQAVIDVIQQHHGTTLVRYFYQRALDASRAPFAPKDASADSNVPFPPVAMIDEAPFRYDGPKPHFKESAVIHLADGIEAASRSLREVTAAQLTALIERLVRERTAEGQLDEAPLTFEEITKIKNSFTFTLLNMLHARVAYPGGEQTTTTTTTTPPAAAKA
ncbi:MAG TPA: HDIG domain-containing protein [Opitutaceae bacterium]|nr:HDIG domain-containing protein [Opitutaceae bacterium]